MPNDTSMKWTDLPPSVVLTAADLCDGHGIFDPTALIEVGVPQELADRYTDVFESNFDDPKYIIYDNKTGEPVKAMPGVYGLNVLAGMIRDFKLNAPEKFGRGSQAVEWQRVLHEHLDPKPETSSV